MLLILAFQSHIGQKCFAKVKERIVGIVNMEIKTLNSYLQNKLVKLLVLLVNSLGRSLGLMMLTMI